MEFELFGFLITGIILFYMLVFGVVTYIINAITWFILGNKANLSYSILAFVPILQFVVFFGIIRKNVLWALIYCIPGIGFLAYLYFRYLFYKNYQTDDIITLVCLVFLPIGYLYTIYMALSSNVRYVPYHDDFLS